MQFRVKLAGSTVVFPSVPVDIPDSSIFIWPMGLDLDGVRFGVCNVRSRCIMIVVYGCSGQDAGVAPEFCFSGEGVSRVLASTGNVKRQGNTWLVTGCQPGNDC